MEKYSVQGMSCAACVSRVENAVSKVPGVSSCTVSLLTNSMGVEGNADSKEILSAVEKAGYKAKKLEKNTKSAKATSENENEELLKDKESPVLAKRLISSLIFLVILMYVSMGHMMLNFPLPGWFMKNGGNHLAMTLVQMFLALIILIINRKFFISGFKSLIHKAPNMDTLVALGSGISFIYSVFSLFAMTDSVSAGNNEKTIYFMNHLYFESSAMIVTLITVGKLLESISKGKTTNALKSLIKLSPKTARIIKDGKEITVSIDEVCKDDIFTVKPGENIPVDGIILEGTSSINESALTGESIPVDKNPGDKVSAATINQDGFIKCRATAVGEDTSFAKIIQMVSDAAATKAPIAKIADKVSGIFVPSVILISIITFTAWIISGANFSTSLSHAIAVLIISCPCALGLATPVAIMVSNGVGAKNGLLYKTSAAMENAGRTQIVVLDKTGTITKGTPHVTDIIPFGCDEKTLLQKAASLESKSEHPLSKAILIKAQEEKLSLSKITGFQAIPGKGLQGKIGENILTGGNLKYIEENDKNNLSMEAKVLAEKFSEEAKTPVFFTENKKLIGIIAISDVIKEESRQAIQELKNMGLYVVMLTGDNKKSAEVIGKKAGVDKIFAEVLPDEKEKIVAELQKEGKVCMVGDGINDAPSLTKADTGMAIGAGTDIAIDAADIVLVKSKLTDVARAIRLSRKTITNIRENLFWAFFYNIILIPIAAGAFHKLLGLDIKPMFGAAAMSLSSFCVVTNALRLNLFNIKNPKHDKKIKNKIFIKENFMTNEKTLKIEGMMCSHCEKHVCDALEMIDGVTSAKANHESKTAVVQLTKEIPDAVFEKAITDAGYTFVN